MIPGSAAIIGPTRPAPAGTAPAHALPGRLDPSAILRVAVHPPVGVARVGNAQGTDDHILAAEVVGAPPTSADRRFRDADGAIRRQAVRFRVYAFLRDGAVREVVADDRTRLEWRVQIANLKAGWYAFGQAMDLPDGLAKPAPRRNADVAGADRAQLDIRPSAVAISGRSLSGPPHSFGDGRFFGEPVHLGEAWTDAQGRLLFFGGLGRSAPRVGGTRPTTFANNDGWHDDVADGPVRARVVLDGQVFDAEPGYVIVAPPNYAPGLFGVVTLDDAVRETFQAAGWLPRPEVTRFSADVWPIFDRMTGLQWVNHGAFMAHGHGSPLDSRDRDVLARLRDASAESAAWRQRVFALFRDPGAGGTLEVPRLPQVYGDSFGEPGDERHPLARLAVTPTQYAHLRRWMAGEFTDDWPGAPPEPPNFDALPPDEQVRHLERAGLHECLGGPFHPGIELTWVMRHPSIWERPYRLRLLTEGTPALQDFGPELKPEICLGAGGPLDGLGPGSLTRWLGVPWQTDEASCNSGAEYTPSLYLSMPTYWGARVPDQVLSREAFNRAGDPQAPPQQRLKHFAHREDWLRDIRGRGYLDRIDTMVREWWQLGIVSPPAQVPAHLPPDSRVEQGRHPDYTGSNAHIELIRRIEQLDAPAELDAGPAAAGAGPGAPAPYVPPRRSYRRGEV